MSLMYGIINECCYVLTLYIIPTKCCAALLAAVTGTPLQNNMVELYGMLAFMYPDVFTTPGPFEAAFNLVKGTVSFSHGLLVSL
jgi:hypothetical protein